MKNIFDNEEIVTKADKTTLPVELNINTQDKLNSLPEENSYQNENAVFQDVGPAQVPEKNYAAGFKETLVHGAFRTAKDIFSEPDLNPISDSTPPGWNAASDESNFVGVMPRNQGYVAAASSPNDAYFRRLEALRKQEEDEHFETGPLTAKIMGGLIDQMPFSVIPLGMSAKYADLTKNLYEASLAETPGLAIGSLLHEGTLNAHEIGGNIHDTMVDTFIDTISGLAFTGGRIGIGKALDSFKLYEARNVFKINYDGFTPEIKVDAEGKVLGFVATPVSNEAMNAAKFDAAQAFLDSSFEKSGLFAIPYLGVGLNKTIATVNPIFRGLNSPFETIRGFTNRVASHSLRTEGIKSGIEKPEDFETLMGIVQGENKVYYMTMQSLLDKRNGIDSKSKVANFTERTKKIWTDEGYIDSEKFGNEVKDVIFSGNAHENNAVNIAADVTKKYLNDTWEQYRQVFDLPKEWMPPPTADGYFPRVYNISTLMERPEQWNNMWVNWFKESDRQIKSLMEPIDRFAESVKLAETNHKSLLTNPSANDFDIKNSAKELAASKRTLRKMKEDLSDKIKSDKTLFLHGEDHGALTGKEAKLTRKLLKPFNQAKKALNTKKKALAKLNQQKFFIENKITNSTSKIKGLKYQEELKELESEIKSHVDEVKELQNKFDEEDDKLQQAVADKKISPRLYSRIPDSQRVSFKNPRNLMKFRKTFESEHAMNEEAEAYRQTILNQTPEDTLQQVLGHSIGAASETPTLKRTLMIPDAMLQDNKFLSNNMPLIVANYRNALHRKISMKTVFQDVTVDGGIAPLTERLMQEFRDQEAAIINNEKLKDNERAKALKNLNKEFKEAKDFMKLSYERMMGRTRGSESVRSFTRFMKLWTVATRLGSVPLTMITDLTANVYKHGFWPSIRDGLLPMLENITHVLDKPEGRPYIENAAHAHLAISHVQAAHNDRDWGGIAMQHVPASGKLGSYLENAAHISGNIAFTNQTENFIQRITANITQSKIMKYMLDFEKGTLSAKDKERLLIYGLDPEKWSKRFLKGWEERGKDGNGFGGYQSRYWEWNDIEASNKMARTIYKSVNDTIIRKGMMDAPFFFDDPILGSIAFLHGWSTAALTRYLTPLMQKPDAQHLTGLVMMLAAGSLVAPLRKISKGQKPIDDETSMFWDAAQDSGVLSPITSLIEDANILTHGRILRGFSNDRYRQRSELSAALGPIFGMGQDVSKIIGMMLDGRLNESDAKRAARLIPMMQPWYLKGLQNKMIEGLDLPKNAYEVENNSSNAYR